MGGVDILESKLRRWPSFPLVVPDDPSDLARLVTVLDRIATESHTTRPIEHVRPGEAGEPQDAI